MEVGGERGRGIASKRPQDWAGSHGGAELRQISANQRQGREARPLLPGAGEPRGWRFPALGGPRAASGGAEGESLGGGEGGAREGEAAYSVPAPEGSDNSGNKEIRAHRGGVRGLEKR